MPIQEFKIYHLARSDQKSPTLCVQAVKALSRSEQSMIAGLSGHLRLYFEHGSSEDWRNRIMSQLRVAGCCAKGTHISPKVSACATGTHLSPIATACTTDTHLSPIASACETGTQISQKANACAAHAIQAITTLQCVLRNRQ